MTQLDVPEHPQPGRQQQPAAHHQPERLPDLRQRHLAEGPAHAEGRRQPHAALARDPQRRHHRRQLQLQQQHDVELRRAGQPAAPSTRAPASTWPASCSASSTRRTATCSTPTPTPRSGPSIALYLQDDFRVTSKLTLNLGLRWDVYAPWIEVDNRQSNFDETTGKFVVASDDAVIDGVKVGRYLQTYSKRDLGPRFGFAYDVRGDGTDDRPRRLRRVLELHARRHLVVEGAEPAVPAVDGADRRRPRTAPTCCSRTACRRLRASTRTGRRRARRGRSSTSTSATPTRGNWNINVQRALGTNYMARSRLRRLAAAGRCCSRATRTRRRRWSA